MTWPPHITVAQVIYRDDKFLVIEEAPYGSKVLSFPAGHLEPSETLIQAAIRETREESGWHSRVTGFLNVSKSKSEQTGVIYLHISLVGEIIDDTPETAIDSSILAVHWMDYASLIKEKHRFRSTTIEHNLQQFQRGEIYPLSLLVDDGQ